MKWREPEASRVARVTGSDARLRFEGIARSYVGIPTAATSVAIVGVVGNPGIDAFGPGTHPVIYVPLDLAPVRRALAVEPAVVIKSE